MPYDKFEQAAPIEVLPNIQPQVDESMIRAVQTASQAFEARAKRKQEVEQAASAAKAAEKKRLMDIKVPTETSSVAAVQNAMTGTSNEAFEAAMLGVPTAQYEAKIKDLKGKGDALEKFTNDTNTVMTKAKETYGAAYEMPQEYQEYLNSLRDPNLNVDDVFQYREKLQNKIATPYRNINFGKLGSIYLDDNKVNPLKTSIEKGLTTTGQTMQSRMWVTDKTKPLIENGVTQKDANGNVIYQQRPPANREETEETAIKFLQSRDGATGILLRQKIQEDDAKSIDNELNTAINNYKTKNNAEPSEEWKEAYKNGVIDKKVVEKAKDIMWDNQNAYMSAFSISKREPSKAAGAGDKVKVATVPYANNVFNVNLTDPNGKIKETQTKSFGTIVTTKDGKPLKYVVSDITAINARTGLTEDFTQNVNVENAITRFMPYRLGKNTGQKIPISIVPKEGEDKAQWRNKSMLQTIKDLPNDAIKQMQGFTPITYFTTVASGAENVKLSPEKQTEYFELDARFKNKPVKKPIAPVKGDKDYDRKLTAYQNAIPKYEEYKRYLGYKEMMPKQADDFYTDTKNVRANIEAVTGQKYDETSLFNRLPKDQQEDFIKAKAEFERRKRELSSAPTPAKSNEPKGGVTSETTKTGGTATKGKIKIVGTKPLVNYNYNQQ